jgi:hypothetical protein
MPEWLYLNEFGRIIRTVFGVNPYLVGSAAEGKKWRDVDVRLMLPEEEFQKHFDIGEENASGTKWAYVCAAYSELGKKLTGLPVDFQIQNADWIYIRHKDDGWKDKPKIFLGGKPPSERHLKQVEEARKEGV